MADKEKKKKTKKKEEGGGDAAAADAPAAEAPKSPSDSTRASRGSRKAAKRSGSNVFSCFSQKQLAEFKGGFQLMDHNKDGIIGKEDLRFVFDQVGRLATEKELDEMLGEASGPMNFTQLVNLFANRLQGSADDDETIISAFKKFDKDGKIDGERLRHLLMTFGEKFTMQEWNDISDQFYVDDKGMIDTESLINMIIGKDSEETEES